MTTVKLCGVYVAVLLAVIGFVALMVTYTCQPSAYDVEYANLEHQLSADYHKTTSVDDAQVLIRAQLLGVAGVSAHSEILDKALLDERPVLIRFLSSGSSSESQKFSQIYSKSLSMDFDTATYRPRDVMGIMSPLDVERALSSVR